MSDAAPHLLVLNVDNSFSVSEFCICAFDHKVDMNFLMASLGLGSCIRDGFACLCFCSLDNVLRNALNSYLTCSVHEEEANLVTSTLSA